MSDNPLNLLKEELENDDVNYKYLLYNFDQIYRFK